MYPVSQQFVNTITAGVGYTIATQIIVSTPQGQTTFDVNVQSGTISIDRTNPVRRQCQLTLAIIDMSIVPTIWQSPLAPFGNTMVVYAGLNYAPAGAPPQLELVPFGIFDIVTVDMNDTGQDLLITVDGYDRSWLISQQGFNPAYSVPAGQDVNTTIVQLIGSIDPGTNFNIQPTPGSSTAATTFDQGSDPWQAALTLAQGVGFELYYDAVGTLVGKPTPDPSTLPIVWDFTEGSTMMTGCERTWTRSGVYNDFIVTSQNTTTDPPIQGEAWITQPGNPLYLYGPFRDIPLYTENDTLTSVGDASGAALQLLNQQQGAYDIVAVTSTPAPMFDIDDVLFVSRERIGVSGLYVVDHVDINFRHDGATTLTTRAVVS